MQYFVFAYIWTLGGNLADASLAKVDLNSMNSFLNISVVSTLLNISFRQFDEFARELLGEVTGNLPPDRRLFW